MGSLALVAQDQASLKRDCQASLSLLGLDCLARLQLLLQLLPDHPLPVLLVLSNTSFTGTVPNLHI